MIANLTFNACSGAADNQQLYYGKSLLVTATPLTGGSGWFLYNGAPIAGGTTSVSIPSLDDNVPYDFYRYCHCPITGSTSPEIKQGIIKYACVTLGSALVASSNSINYILNIPSSANNPGSNIGGIRVSVVDAVSTTTYASTVYTTPFSSSISDSISGLTPNYNYKLLIDYLGTSPGVVLSNCLNSAFTTNSACAAPTVTITNVGANNFDINYSSLVNSPGDMYSISINGSNVVSGLAYTSTPYSVTGLTASTLYSVQVTKSCGTGGSASTSLNQTTANTTNLTLHNAIIGTTITNASLFGPITLAGGATDIVGYHSAYSSAVSVTFTGTIPPFPINGFGLTLKKNGTVVGCIQTSTAGTYTFPAVTFAGSDLLRIDLATATC